MNNTSGDSFKTFGELLRHLRVREHMTQRELALAVGYTDSQITRLEKGQRAPDLDVIMARFIDALQLTNQPETAARFVLLARQASNAGVLAVEDEVKLSSDNSRPARRHNLPATLTPLIGRDADANALRSLLLRDDVRLVTVIGSPGVGKTRLVQQTARDALDAFDDGVWFVPLAPVNDTQLIPVTIVQSLDLRLQDMLPLPAVKRHLEDKRLLLVLDNIEQLLVEDKAAQTAHIVAELLATAPGLKILTTSRAALHVTGEHLFDLHPLGEEPSIILFVQRAKAVKASFELTDQNRTVVKEICQRLEGLPLAIELAAARIQLFDPIQLLSRLKSRLGVLTKGALDAPARQRTLRDTIEWSYNLLTADEKLLFNRLGVFTSGCTIDAAEQIAGKGLTTSTVDNIQSLADKRLIQLVHLQGTTRVNMLETLREYALTRLIANNEIGEIEIQWAIFYTYFAEQFVHQPFLDPLSVDKAQLLYHEAMADWLHEDYIRAEKLFIESVELFRETSNEFEIAMVLSGLAGIQRDLGKYELAIDTFKESISIAKRANHVVAEWAAINGYAELLFYAGDNENAAQQYRAAMDLCKKFNSSVAEGIVLMGMGRLALAEGDIDHAVAYLSQSESIFHNLQQRIGLSWVMHHAGFARYLHEHNAQETETLIEALMLQNHMGRKLRMVEIIERFAWIAADTHQPNRAAVLLGAAEALRMKLSAPFPRGEMRLQESYLKLAREGLDQTSFSKA